MRFLDFFSRKKKPVEAKPKFVGMSQTSVISKVTGKVSPAEHTKPEQKVAKGGGVITPVQPYVAIIKDDIKRLLRIDVESRKKREEYKDFMEQHFGRK
jgi:hypothetical protein